MTTLRALYLILASNQEFSSRKKKFSVPNDISAQKMVIYLHACSNCVITILVIEKQFLNVESSEQFFISYWLVLDNTLLGTIKMQIWTNNKILGM